MRAILEHFSRHIKLKRCLPAEFNATPMIVSPDAALSYWKFNLSDQDPMLLNTVRQFIQEEQIVWDIGANVGLFTFAAASRVGSKGQVLAVEADIWCVDLLRRSCTLAENENLRVDVLPAAVSNAVDIVKFNIAQRGRATNFLDQVAGSTQTGGVRETQLVPSVSLDWLLEKMPAPDFIKIDVEGAERLVLEGADRMLSEIRPVILCEVSSRHQAWLTQKLKQNQYVFYDAHCPDEGEIDLASFNTLAIPEIQMPLVTADSIDQKLSI